MKLSRLAFGSQSPKSRRKLKNAAREVQRAIPAFVEPLESRTLLSGSITLMADYNYIYNGENAPSAVTWTDFGVTTADGSVPLTRTYTIQNNSTGALTMIGTSPVTITSAAGQNFFTVSSQPSTTVAAGGTTTFTITFTPTAYEQDYATVNIASSDAAGPFHFGIKATGIATTTLGTQGLQYSTITAGSGAGATNNEILDVNYAGYLADGTLFDSSLNAGRTPFEFDLGVGSVIAGWDQGLLGMKIGESRMLVIPSALGYGDSGSGVIPGGATLIFDVNCLDIIQAVGHANNNWVAVNDGGSSPSTANATSWGTVNTTSTAPITHQFDIEAFGGDLNLLLASNPITVTGSSAFTVTQQLTVNSNNTSGIFSITYTPANNVSSAIVTIHAAPPQPNNPTSPNFTFTIKAQGPSSDDGAAKFAASTWEITGDAYNPLNLSTTDSVKVVITNGPTQTIPANEISPELQNAFGTSYHDFTYSVPPLSIGVHAINVYAIDPVTHSSTLLATTSVTSDNNLFDEAYYLLSNPTVAAQVAAGTYSDGYQEYLAYGQYHGYSPSPYWNEAWYLKENPTVAAQVKAGTYSSGFMQFYLTGQYNQSVTGLLYFDTSYYLQNNPDVASAVNIGEFSSAFEHYVLAGQFEGRSPMKYFSSSVYDSNNPSVVGGWTSGETLESDYEHFILYGQYQGLVASNFFNQTTYLNDNPSVATEISSGQYPDAFQQWLEQGIGEGLTAV